MRINKAALLLLPFVCCFSCFYYMDENTARCLEDSLSPVINIISPGDYAECGTLVEVSGSAIDPSDMRDAKGKIDSLVYLVQPNNIKGQITVQPDNSFRFRFSMDDNVIGPISVEISATDWNNNKQTVTLHLQKRKSGIPSFSVLPGNKQVELSWDNDDSTTYSLYYTTDGSLPYVDEKKSIFNFTGCKKDVQSPVPWDGLLNGYRYTFLLKAHPEPGWPESEAYVQAIPLSAQSLAPQVSGDYKQIKISWKPIAGCKQYTIYRSDRLEDGFVGLPGLCTTNTFTDNVPDGRWYYYKIAFYDPELHIDLPGLAANGAQTSPFPAGGATCVKSMILNGIVGQMLISNSFLYASRGYDGLEVIDISDPNNASSIRTVNTTETINDLAVAGSRLFASSSARINVVDISNPAGASKVDELIAPTTILGVAASGTFAASKVDDAGIQILNISDPSHLLPVGTVHTPGSSSDLLLSGSYLYVADGKYGVQIFDLNNLGDGTPAHNVPTTGFVWELSLSGSILCAAAGNAGVQIIDVSDPLHAYECKTVRIKGSATRVASSGSYVCTIDNPYVQVIDYSDPANAHLVKSVCTGYVDEIALDNAYLYVSDLERHLKIFDIDDPGHAEIRRYVTTRGQAAKALTVSGSYVYVAANTAGLKVIDASVPENAEVCKEIDTPGNAESVTINGFYAYVADGYDDLQVIDTRKSGPDAIVQHVPLDGYAYKTVVCGDYAYVADGYDGVVRIDISNPSAPEKIDPIQIYQCAAYSVAATDSYLYVAFGEAGLQVIDIGAPDKPGPSKFERILRSKQTAPAYGIALSGSYAYVSTTEGVSVFDISNPLDIKESAPVKVLCRAQGDVFISGKYAYVADWIQKGPAYMQILDITDPFYPKICKTIDIPGAAWNVAVSGSYAYVACGESGVAVIRLGAH